MDLTAELEKLQARKQKLEIRREKLATTLEAKQAAQDKLLAKLAEKNIDPDDLPERIQKLEAGIENQLTEFTAALGAFESRLDTVDAALAAAGDA